MKAYRWIDKYNYKNSFKIIREYSLAKQNGKSKLFCLHPLLWPKYLLRLTLVFFSIILFKKSAYHSFAQLINTPFSFIESPKKTNPFISKFKDIIATLFGYRFFLEPRLLPLLNIKSLKQVSLDFPNHENPTVSIVIPAGDDLAFTYNCLRSISENTAREIPFQIIIVDDCPTDFSKSFFQSQIKEITYITNEKALGLSACYGKASGFAKGEFICLLNNHVQVKKNWLSSLLETLQDKNVGLAGSQLIYTNGILQQAGGIIFSDASVTSYGKFEDINNPIYNYAREADYCATACMLLRKKDFDDVAKFDLRDYSDVELSFAVRHGLKKKVVYQALSKVVCYKDFSAIQQDRQAIEKLSENIGVDLNLYPKPNDVKAAVSKYFGHRIIMIDDNIPEPDKDSGSVRLNQIIQILLSLGNHVTFLPNTGIKNSRYFEKLAAKGVQVLYRFPNRNGMLQLLQQQLADINLIWVCKPHNYASLQGYFTDKQKIVYDTVDLHYVRIGREAKLLNSAELQSEANSLKDQELSFAKKSDLTLTVTQDEKESLIKEGIKHVEVVPNIHILSNSNEARPFNERKGLLFIGGYAHKPNVDAAKWLIHHIMPTVWEKDPAMVVTLLGSNPPAEVLELASEKVIVPGYVEDVSEYFNNNRIFVAPLRYGAGMKGKIGQSLEFGLPIVSTDIGVEGMNLVDGEQVLTANENLLFAQKILTLYNDQYLWEKIRKNSIEALLPFTPEAVSVKINMLLKSLNSR